MRLLIASLFYAELSFLQHMHSLCKRMHRTRHIYLHVRVVMTIRVVITFWRNTYVNVMINEQAAAYDRKHLGYILCRTH